ncbi:MAG: hypothetical protein JO232_24180 [Verrucomicrobia bacterium]|nr:hypothetical protein [Verrucomicrobiota bacterium]
MNQSDTPHLQVVVQDPPLLRALLLAAGDDLEAQTAIRKAFHACLEGAKGSPFVMNAVLLSAIGNALLSKKSSAGKTNSQLPNLALDELKSAQDRSHELIETSFEKLWRLIADTEKKAPMRAGGGKHKCLTITLAILLAILAIAIAYTLGVIAGQRDTTQHVARTLYDSDQVGPWLSKHGGFLIFRPTQDSKGKVFHSIIVLSPNIQAGITEPGEAFINLPD